MNINELEQLAKAATPGPWKLSGTEHVVAGGNYVVALDCRSEDAKHIAAANPSAISELISAYRESVAALKATTFALEHRWEVIANRAAPVMEGVIDAAHTTGIQALDTAKRLGVE